MPRPRDVVMKPQSKADLREAAFKAAIDKHQPYKTWKDTRVKDKTHVIVYTSPVNHSRREVMAGIVDKATAKELITLLEREWFEGRMSVLD